jgi:hypothetical protein
MLSLSLSHAGRHKPRNALVSVLSPASVRSFDRTGLFKILFVNLKKKCVCRSDRTDLNLFLILFLTVKKKKKIQWLKNKSQRKCKNRFGSKIQKPQEKLETALRLFLLAKDSHTHTDTHTQTGVPAATKSSSSTRRATHSRKSESS